MRNFVQLIYIARGNLFGKQKFAGRDPRLAIYMADHLMYYTAVMKKTLFAYIFKEIAVPFLLGMGVFTFVLLMGRLLRLADLVVAKGVPFSDILRLVVYLLPSFCLVTIPMAFLLAVLLAFGRLSGDSEITAMKACGVSLSGLLPPVLTFAALAYLTTTFITIYALPWGNTSFKKLLFDIVESRATLTIKEQVFNDAFPGMVLYVDRYLPDQNQISGVLIQDERNGGEPSTIFARSGVLIADPPSKTVRLQLRNGGIHRSQGKDCYRLMAFTTYDLSINLNQASHELSKNELDMTFAELRNNMQAPNQDARMLRDLKLEFQRRFSLPIACFVFALVGMPLGLQNQRSGKAGGFSISIGILLIYYVVLSAGKTLGEKGVVDPALAMWTPNLIFIAFGVYLFKKTNEEQRIALFDLLPQIAGYLRSRLGRRRGRP